MSTPMLVTARVNGKCQAVHRGRYEDPLDDLCKQKSLGSVEGGGSQLDRNGEVAYCEISIALCTAEAGTPQAIVDALKKLGAPKGSKLLLGPEGFAQALDGVGAMHGYMNSARETAVYSMDPRLRG